MRKIKVFRVSLSGVGIEKGQYDTPSDALKAATQGRAAETNFHGKPQWYVAFPLEGSRWDIWYI